ncbi:MAG: hypothetical protein GX774_12310 [Armatimonadetes bacterium]|nr:hypothetical protein [Armatimonadota bacterium]
MEGTLTLFTVPAEEPRRGRPGIIYVCPECWQRAAPAVRLDEPPLCAPCGCRMRLFYDPAAAPPPQESPEAPLRRKGRPGRGSAARQHASKQ